VAASARDQASRFARKRIRADQRCATRGILDQGRSVAEIIDLEL
jgi:hypothetical protein